MAKHPAASTRLWAPWRMAYIRGLREPGCLFCRTAADPEGRRERLVLCVRPEAFVMMNRYPFAAGHLLVVPRRHAADLTELASDELAALFELVRDSVTALRAAVLAEGMNVGLNLGAVAGAGIAEHLHAHVVPRWRGDLNYMPVVAGVHVMPEALEATYERLLPYFQPLDRAPRGP